MTRKARTTILALLAFCGAAMHAHAQGFGVDWFTIDGGGGTSSGGGFTVNGTIGQPDAGGPMTGGAFAVTGGFWALPIVVPVPNAPVLRIVRGAPGFATISWAPDSPGFLLQMSEDAQSWANAPSGATNPTTVPATLPAKFYRLHKP